MDDENSISGTRESSGTGSVNIDVKVGGLWVIESNCCFEMGNFQDNIL